MAKSKLELLLHAVSKLSRSSLSKSFPILKLGSAYLVAHSYPDENGKAFQLATKAALRKASACLAYFLREDLPRVENPSGAMGNSAPSKDMGTTCSEHKRPVSATSDFNCFEKLQANGEHKNVAKNSPREIEEVIREKKAKDLLWKASEVACEATKRKVLELRKVPLETQNLNRATNTLTGREDATSMTSCIQTSKTIQQQHLMQSEAANNERVDVVESQLSLSDLLPWLKRHVSTTDIFKWRLGVIPSKQVPPLLQRMKELLFSDLEMKAPSQLQSSELLRLMQVFFLCVYCQQTVWNDSNGSVRKQLLGHVNILYDSLKDKTELLSLTRAMYLLIRDNRPTSSLLQNVQNNCASVESANCPAHTIEFLQKLLANADVAIHCSYVSSRHANNRFMSDDLVSVNQFHTTKWTTAACDMLIQACFSLHSKAGSFDFGACLRRLLAHDIWKPNEIIQLLTHLTSKLNSQSPNIARILDFMLTYRVPATLALHQAVLERLKGIDVESLEMVGLELLKNIYVELLENDNVLELLKETVTAKGDSDLEEILEKIKVSKCLSSNIVVRAGEIVKHSLRQLRASGYPEQLCRKKGNYSHQEWKNCILSDQTSGRFSDVQLATSLAGLCCAVKKVSQWWPRVAQMVSWTVLLLAEDTHGRLVEISTGEGKTCIIAMVSAMLAVHGKSVDIVTSSSVLAERDAKEWKPFYSLFEIKVDHNSNKEEDGEKRQCYKSDIVYGTVQAFAADILRQEFQMVKVRSERTFDAVIVDEVDFMLLDKGVQFTYLSHIAVGLRHVEPILSMIWDTVSNHRPVVSKQGEMFFTDRIQPFYEAVADICDCSTHYSGDPLQLLLLVEQEGVIREGFTEQLHRATEEEKVHLLKEFNSGIMVEALQVIGRYVPYNIQLYVLLEGGVIETVPTKPMGKEEDEVNGMPFLVTTEGGATVLYDDAIFLKGEVTDRVKSVVQEAAENSEFPLIVPNSLKNFVQERLHTWVESAFVAMRMSPRREYIISNGEVIPVDFKSTGIIEVSMRWSEGLQQFLELKHQLKMTALSLVTNFMSSTVFFKRYSANVYGVTGTLGSDTDQQFLNRHFNVDFVSMPTHRPTKFYEEEGKICDSKDKWLNKICEKVRFETTSKRWRKCGRAVLVICEDITTAFEVSDLIKKKVTDQVKLYTRSDNDEKQETDGKLGPGDVMVATNLAGRGTDIEVIKKVNEGGGLFVLVTFLPMNTRVEKQAFGRTARKGLPGSAQIILNASTLQANWRKIRTMEQLKAVREKKQREYIEELETTEMAHCLLKERLFSQYCAHLKKIYDQIKKNNEQEQNLVIDSLNEHWGMWLEKRMDRLLFSEETMLRADLDSCIKRASLLVLAKESPSTNIYHAIKVGNELMAVGNYKDACRYYDRAIAVDARWAAIAYYKRAFCTIQNADKGYKENAKLDLEQTLKSLQSYISETALIRMFAGSSRHATEEDAGLYASLDLREAILHEFEHNTRDSILKLQQIDGDVVAEEAAVFSLLPDSKDDSSAKQELEEMSQLGLVRIFSVSKKRRFCFAGLFVFLLGPVQIAAGIAMIVASHGGLTPIGIGLILEGVSDMIDGAVAMYKGEFDWKDWGLSKVAGYGLTFAGAGAGNLAAKGVKALRVAKGIRKLSFLSKSSLKASAKVAVKEGGKKFSIKAAEKVAMNAGRVVENELLDLYVKKVEAEIPRRVKLELIKACSSGSLSNYIERLAAYYFNGLLKEDLLAKTCLTTQFHGFSDAAAKSLTQQFEWNQRVEKIMQTLIQSMAEKLPYSKSASSKIFRKAAVQLICTAEITPLSLTDLTADFVQGVCDNAAEFCDIHEVPKHTEDNVRHLEVENLKDVVSALATPLQDLFLARFRKSVKILSN